MKDRLSQLGAHDSITTMYLYLFNIVASNNGRHTSLREPPVVFFFVKYCLGNDLGVPGILLAAYNDMRKQLGCGFLRCANPSCEHNKLDKSAGKVKFKKCSRCQAVIYCSRECQTAHYPEHKTRCRKGLAEQAAHQRARPESAEEHKEEELLAEE